MSKIYRNDNIHTALEKIADIAIGPKDGVNTAGGIFVGVPGDKNSPGYSAKARKAAMRVSQLIKEHKSLQKAREVYSKENPTHYTTVSIKREKKPSSGFLGYKKLFGGKKYKSSVKSFADRSKSPRVFVRAGKSGGYQQTAFYSEVARGLRDNELNQPHVPKKDRVVYT
tara:strand:- start:5238 stop:5744 length:507 start_codon:yes stop_codon:yes gene_type:complete